MMSGHEIELHLKPLDGEVSIALDNVLSEVAQRRNNYAPGTAKAIIIIRAIKLMKIDGEVHRITGKTRQLPPYVDEENREILLDRVLREIFRMPENQWVLWNEDYAEVFERYAPEQNEALEANPI
jgi:hypothetical protein